MIQKKGSVRETKGAIDMAGTRIGLASVSFRALGPGEIIAAVRRTGLSCIEWGSDVHAPPDQPEKIRKIAAEQKTAGLVTSSYGTYFRLGETSLNELERYIEAADLLGTNVLRLWCGTKSASLYTAGERDRLYDICRSASAIAARCGAVLCMECHEDTLTDTAESATSLMEAAGGPSFRMYWQSLRTMKFEENLSYAARIAPWVERVHVFYRRRDRRTSLRKGLNPWRRYLNALGGEKTLLLEFMPDDSIQSLQTEAEALCELTGHDTEDGER